MQSSDSSKQTRASVIDYALLGGDDHRKKESASTSANTHQNHIDLTQIKGECSVQIPA